MRLFFLLCYNVFMTLQQFIEKYNGKYVDIDGGYGYQCKDLFSAYNTEIAKNPVYVYGDAWKLFDAVPAEYYEKYLKASGTPMMPGDVVIWQKSFGGFGHVGICTEANATSFKAFSQNYPKVTKLDANGKVITNGSPCNISQFAYAPVYGWLRPKKDAIIAKPMTLHDFIVDGMPADERITALKAQVKKYGDMINSPTDGIAALKNTIVGRDELLDSKRQIIIDLEKALEEKNNNPVDIDRTGIAKEEIAKRLTTKISQIVDWIFD